MTYDDGGDIYAPRWFGNIVSHPQKGSLIAALIIVSSTYIYSILFVHMRRCLLKRINQ